MGGFTFDTDFATDGEIAHINMGGKELWLKAIHASGAEDVLNLARCRDDLDGECASKGCLNPDGVRAWEVSINDFLAMHQRTLSIIQSHPERLPGGRAEAEEAIDFLRDLVKRIERALANGAKRVIILDDLSCPDLYPCPRTWSTSRAPTHDELEECQTLTGVISETYMNYDEALKKLHSGEWEENFKQAYGWVSHDK